MSDFDPAALDPLIEEMARLGIARLSYEDATRRLMLDRTAEPAPVVQPAADGPSAAPGDAGQETLLAPMYGRFYSAPDPGQPPCVAIGERVVEGQPLCILEAMKTLSRFEAPFACTIVARLCTDGQDISPGTPLFTVTREAV